MSILKKLTTCLPKNYIISNNCLYAYDFAKKISLNFINSADNKTVLNEFYSLFEQKRYNGKALAFDVKPNEIALHKLRNSNALDIYRLSKKHIVEAHPRMLLALKQLFNAGILHTVSQMKFPKKLCSHCLKSMI